MPTQPTATATATSRFPGLFALTFLVLLVGKLGFDWAISWFIVFLPLIIGAGLTIIALVIFAIIAFIAVK